MWNFKLIGLLYPTFLIENICFSYTLPYKNSPLSVKSKSSILVQVFQWSMTKSVEYVSKIVNPGLFLVGTTNLIKYVEKQDLVLMY